MHVAQNMFATGLYHVQDQSGLRSVEQARGGKCPSFDRFLCITSQTWMASMDVGDSYTGTLIGGPSIQGLFCDPLVLVSC